MTSTSLKASSNSTRSSVQLPLQLWGNYAENQDPDDMNTAWSAGVLLGKASNYHTWEAGVAYEVLEKDAIFGQFVDSDFADGVTDGEGWIFRAGYAPQRNWSREYHLLPEPAQSSMCPMRSSGTRPTTIGCRSTSI